MLSPDIERVIEIHDEIMKDEKIKGLKGKEGYKLLDSALNQAFIIIFGEEKYKTPLEKATRILVGIVKNHPFIDGNKRTAFVVAKELLEEHGETLTGYDIEEMADFIEHIASSQEKFEILYTKALHYLKKFHHG